MIWVRSGCDQDIFSGIWSVMCSHYTRCRHDQGAIRARDFQFSNFPYICSHYARCGPVATSSGMGIRAPSQYPKRRLFVRSRKVSKPRDWYFKLSYRFEIWQAHRQHCCRSALSNFRAIRQFYLQISRLRDLTRSYGKTSFRILRRGHDPGVVMDHRYVYRKYRTWLHPDRTLIVTTTTKIFLKTNTQVLCSAGSRRVIKGYDQPVRYQISLKYLPIQLQEWKDN